jgi:hypothetical protein
VARALDEVPATGIARATDARSAEAGNVDE